MVAVGEAYGESYASCSVKSLGSMTHMRLPSCKRMRPMCSFMTPAVSKLAVVKREITSCSVAFPA